jgi:hypothetical protein
VADRKIIGCCAMTGPARIHVKRAEMKVFMGVECWRKLTTRVPRISFNKFKK